MGRKWFLIHNSWCVKLVIYGVEANGPSSKRKKFAELKVVPYETIVVLGVL
jgi:hypothetical protein